MGSVEDVQTASGWLGHSNVPRTGSPSPVMKRPIVLVPVHERMRYSLSPTTVMEGFTITGESIACERGRMGNKEAPSRSTML